jgi:DUF1365 family protein
VTSSALYRGSLIHTRRDRHARRTFRYGVYMAALELSELAVLHAELRLFSHNRRNLFALYDGDYADLAALPALRAQHPLPIPASTTLVTNLRVAGYVFNPVSFFLDYDTRGELTGVIAEVNNNYGGRHRYVLGPEQRIAHDGSAEPRTITADGTKTVDRTGDRIGYRTDRTFFVSPFLHGDRTYDWWFPRYRAPDQLAIGMHVASRARARIFTATVTGHRVPLTDLALLAAAVRYPLMTAQVIGLIHLEALVLRFRYGAPYRRPGPDHRPLADVQGRPTAIS